MTPKLKYQVASSLIATAMRLDDHTNPLEDLMSPEDKQKEFEDTIDDNEPHIIDGVKVDPSVAEVVVHVSDMLSEDNQQRLMELPTEKVIELALKVAEETHA